VLHIFSVLYRGGSRSSDGILATFCSCLFASLFSFSLVYILLRAVLELGSLSSSRANGYPPAFSFFFCCLYPGLFGFSGKALRCSGIWMVQGRSGPGCGGVTKGKKGSICRPSGGGGKGERGKGKTGRKESRVSGPGGHPSCFFYFCVLHFGKASKEGCESVRGEAHGRKDYLPRLLRFRVCVCVCSLSCMYGYISLCFGWARARKGEESRGTDTHTARLDTGSERAGSRGRIIGAPRSWLWRHTYIHI